MIADNAVGGLRTVNPLRVAYPWKTNMVTTVFWVGEQGNHRIAVRFAQTISSTSLGMNARSRTPIMARV